MSFLLASGIFKQFPVQAKLSDLKCQRQTNLLAKSAKNITNLLFLLFVNKITKVLQKKNVHDLLKMLWNHFWDNFLGGTQAKITLWDLVSS